MILSDLVVLDYETETIERRPNYPPKPVGCAVIMPGKTPRYYAWGHPTENNCTKTEFKKVLLSILKGKYRVLYHNGKFDIEVSEAHFGTSFPNFWEWEDSMFLTFLANPRSRDLKLKSIAERELDMLPNEQDELRDWILANVPEAKKAKTKWSGFIHKAPGKLVGKYAAGDVIRTLRLYKKFYPYIKDNHMLEAYNIEKQIMPITIDMEKKGVPIDVRSLRKDLKKAKIEKDSAEKRIYKRVGIEFNLNSPKQKIEVFESKKLVTEWNYNTDKSGNYTSPKTGIEDLLLVCNDLVLVRELEVFSKLSKVIGTYMEPWLESAEQDSSNVFYPWFNQIRGDNDKGTKTGRFSSNFQQVPKEAENKVIPFMRNYVTGGSSDCVLLARDFSQQELRVLAFYEQFDLFKEYLKNPRVDIHERVRQIILNKTGIDVPRWYVKTLNFLIIYGGGLRALTSKLKADEDTCRTVKQAHQKALPGVKSLMRDITSHSKAGHPVYTAGGREYYAEAGYEYRMINTEIQASSADHAKRSMIRVHEACKLTEDTRIMITVHDELINKAPKHLAKKAMALFKEAMEADDLFIPMPMVSDGKIGSTWGNAKTVQEK